MREVRKKMRKQLRAIRLKLQEKYFPVRSLDSRHVILIHCMQGQGKDGNAIQGGRARQTLKMHKQSGLKCRDILTMLPNRNSQAKRAEVLMEKQGHLKVENARARMIVAQLECNALSMDVYLVALVSAKIIKI